MRSACVFRLDRSFGLEDEGADAIATLANMVDIRAAHREDQLHVLSIVHGFAGAALVEGRLHDTCVERVASERFDRLLQALEALTAEQRAALELGAPRMAALAMLDELRGLYATGELAGARRMTERVLADLEEAFGAPAPLGEAKLRRPIVRTHAELARLCEQTLGGFVHDVPQALGRLRQLFRIAADLGGGARAPLESQPEALRRSAFTTLTPAGFEMIELPYGVVHPTQWPSVAARLGVSIEEARARLYPREDEPDPFEEDDGRPSGPRGHAAVLGDLVVRAIPVIPEDERPPLYFPASGPHTGATEIADPLTELYGSLRSYIARFHRLAELGAPDIIHDGDSAVVQRIVDQLAAATAPLDVAKLDGWGAKPPRERVRLDWRGKNPLAQDDGSGEPSGTPPTCVWMTEDRIAVCIDDVVRVISIAGNRVVHDFSTSYARLQACDDSGRYLVTTANGLMFGGDVPIEFGCYDTEAKAWLAELPAHIPAVTFGKDQPEDGVLFELRRNESFDVTGGDRPTAMCWAHGNRAVLLSCDYAALLNASIRSTLDCMEEVSSKTLEARAVDVPVLTAEGRVVEPADIEQDDGEYAMYEAVPCAIARTGEAWRVLLPSRHVADLGHTYFQIGYPLRAASFAPGGRRLALVTESELQIVDIADRAIVWRYDL